MIARHVLTVLAVDDAHRAAAFYEAAFGWLRTVSVPPYVELTLPGGHRLGLYQRVGFAAQTGVLPVATPLGGVSPAELYLHVDDLPAACTRLAAAGARQLSPATLRGWGETVAYYADPDGHVVAVAAST